MKKISRKLLTSGLSLAFATVALGTTTFAWFTTNAQVKADITVGVQSTGDSILISTDCFTWGASASIDASDFELKPVTYVADSSELSADDDSFTDMDGNEDNTSMLTFKLYLKVSSANQYVMFDNIETADVTEVSNSVDSADWTNYQILKPTTFKYAAGGADVTLDAGQKVKADAVNALRSILDVSDFGSATNSDYLDLTNATGAVAAAFGSSTLTYTRQDKIVDYEGDGTSPSTITNGTVVNFGQTLMANNAANAYINAVLEKEFSPTGYHADADYEEHALQTRWGSKTSDVDADAICLTTAREQIVELKFTYWIEGYDADCFDVIMAQGFNINLGFKTIAKE